MTWSAYSRSMDERCSISRERTCRHRKSDLEGIASPHRPRTAFFGFLLTILCGCAMVAPGPVTPVAPAVRVEEPLTEWEIQLVASLISLSDRRVFDSAMMSAAATSPQARVRRQAAYAAARIGGDQARVLARHLTEDADDAVAAVAVFAVGELEDSSAVPFLSRTLLDADSGRGTRVRAEAADALRKIGGDGARTAIRGYLLGIESALDHLDLLQHGSVER